MIDSIALDAGTNLVTEQWPALVFFLLFIGAIAFKIYTWWESD